MPEPPLQNDMRTQGLPPLTLRAETGSFSVQGSPAVLLVVNHPAQLPDALRQHDKSVVIENSPANAGLRNDFDKLLKWQKWKDTNRLLWLAALIFILFTQMVMSNRYKLDASWHAKWDVYEVGGKITLTPSP
jgi:hypothetical protein